MDRLRADPGYPDFRQAIADYISASRGISVTGQNVIVVPGGKPIMFFSMLAVVEPGDEVIYPNPGFPIYESVVNFLGATPGTHPARRITRFLVRPRSARIEAVESHEDDRAEFASQSHRRGHSAR